MFTHLGYMIFRYLRLCFSISGFVSFLDQLASLSPLGRNKFLSSNCKYVGCLRLKLHMFEWSTPSTLDGFYNALSERRLVSGSMMLYVPTLNAFVYSPNNKAMHLDMTGSGRPTLIVVMKCLTDWWLIIHVGPCFAHKK